MTKYYDTFSEPAIESISEFVCETGVPVVDMRVCRDSSIILEVRLDEEGDSIDLETLVRIALFFGVPVQNLFVSNGHEEGLLVITALDQGRWEFDDLGDQPPVPTDEELATPLRMAFSLGNAVGKDEGYRLGYNDGQAEVYDDAFGSGYEDGQAQGFDDGYQAALADNDLDGSECQGSDPWDPENPAIDEDFI